MHMISTTFGFIFGHTVAYMYVCQKADFFCFELSVAQCLLYKLNPNHYYYSFNNVITTRTCTCRPMCMQKVPSENISPNL